MKRIVLFACAIIGMTLGAAQNANASWSQLGYSGYQPWWNIFAKRYKCLTPEEERLQKFWHDYYDALKHYYAALDHIDWVAYYKNHGYQINGGCGGYGGGRINYAPVVVTPNISWGMPNGCMGGAPMAPMGPMGPMGGPMMGGMPGPMGGPMMGSMGGPMGGPMGAMAPPAFGPSGMPGFGGFGN